MRGNHRCCRPLPRAARAARRSSTRSTAHAQFLRASGEFEAQRARRAHEVFVKLLRDAAATKILEAALARPDAAAVLADVAACRLDPHAAADLLVGRIHL